MTNMAPANIPLLIVEDEPPLARRMQQQLAAAWPEADLLPYVLLILVLLLRPSGLLGRKVRVA